MILWKFVELANNLGGCETIFYPLHSFHSQRDGKGGACLAGRHRNVEVRRDVPDFNHAPTFNRNALHCQVLIGAIDERKLVLEEAALLQFGIEYDILNIRERPELNIQLKTS